ncbi:MAG: NTP transferase domain-containing protein [Candidatus Eisenbacteria bacterium]|uniref:Glucose-1-phosphate adenylyltransferase n=1 Tax=Eiseniibacteriota bacterium TaxID=2212470 RepID=A0A849SJU1_UNCEI|nr:NTP transferase domain-containing protein [Candidatus Eisenbacteria bacterium]
MLAGGLGSRLCLLSERRAKPAVPFGGKYRIIDFSLSNCVNSGIYDIGVLTQYRPTSLHQHVGIGRPWDLDRTRGGIQLLQPALGSIATEWYQGTADAIYRNLVHLRRRRCEQVLVLSGDHIYKMNYDVMFAFHVANRASVTVAVTEVKPEEISQFGILETDRSGRVTAFKEKPRQAESRLASMGVYLFDREALFRLLREDAAREDSTHDFGKDILPRLVQRQEGLFAYRYGGYWQDVGTLDSFFEANMAMASEQPPMDLNDPGWLIHTQSADRPPVRFEPGGSGDRSLVANGCRVAGRVERSVLFPGVHVMAGAVVRDSILMHDCVIGPDSTIERVIFDKEVQVGSGARVGDGDDFTPNHACPDHLSNGLVVAGKGARLPGGISVGRNARIGAGVRENAITNDIPAGGVVHGPDPEH